MQTYKGYIVQVTDHLPAEWNFSKCKSPSRAERRWKRQRHPNPHMFMEPSKALVLNGVIYVSPRMYQQMKAEQWQWRNSYQ